MSVHFWDISGTVLRRYPSSMCPSCGRPTDYQGWGYSQHNGLVTFYCLKCGSVKYDKHIEDVTDSALLEEIRDASNLANDME